MDLNEKVFWWPVSMSECNRSEERRVGEEWWVGGGGGGGVI